VPSSAAGRRRPAASAVSRNRAPSAISTLTTAGRTAEGRTRVALTGTASAPDPARRASSPAHGRRVSRRAECTRGRMGASSQGNGCKGSGTVWGWNVEDGGHIVASGRRVRWDGMESGTDQKSPWPSTKERGRLDFRRATAEKRTLTEVYRHEPAFL